MRPGGLGLGQSEATTVNLIFLLSTYIAQLLGAIVADGWLGRYKTILYTSMYVTSHESVHLELTDYIRSYFSGLIILCATSTSSALDSGAGLGGVISAMGLLVVGIGGTKSNLPAFLGQWFPT